MNPLAQAIYEAYPLKKAPGAAEKAILKALKGIQKEEDMGLMEAHSYLLSRAKEFGIRTRKGNPKLAYVKYPSTWMNQQCYKEDPEGWGPLPEASDIPEESWSREFWSVSIKHQWSIPFPEGKWEDAWNGLPGSIKSLILQAWSNR